jgi:trimeric autotransporter adhesin
MLTPLRLAPVRFTTFGLLACFFALGCFDTVHAQGLTVSPNNLVFTAPQGGNPNPPTQTVTVGGTGSYIISTNAAWIFAATSSFGGGTSGNAPDTITVQINSTSLATGSYSGTITLQPTGGTGAVTITVSLTVSGSGNTTSSLSASPSQLSFGYEIGQALPAPKTSQIISTGIGLPFSFSITTAPTSNCQTGWLQATVSTSNTPATLTVSIANPSNALGPGTCSGNITIVSTTPSNGTTTTLVGVVLFVSTSSLLNVAVPSALSNVTLQQGGAPVQFNVALSSTDNNPLAFTAQVTAGAGWLAISPSFGTVPGNGGTINIDVQVTPGTVLAVGTYQGSIQINSSGLLNNVLSIPITLNLTSRSSVTVTPAGTIGFNQAQGGTLPGAQTVTLSGATSSSFVTVVTPQQNVPSWLLVTPANGSMTPQTPATLNLSILANTLPQGVYSSQIAISFSNSSIPAITIFVSLSIAPPAAALVTSPTSLSFSYQVGGAAPSGQSMNISNPASGSLSYTVASISDSWLAVAPSSGTTPGTLVVSVSPQNLAPGSYSGSFTLSSQGLTSATVNVTLFVSASTTPQPFIISNAASGIGSQLAPGEIISIKGSGLGPGNPVSFDLTTLNNPTLAGVQVTFNGYSGTLLYVSSTQINVTVPYEVASNSSVSIVVIYQGVPSAAIVQPVGATSLGLFTDNATGGGQAAAVNSNYAYNTAATPALQGSYISVYATGGGQTNPASFDGEVSPSTSLLPLLAQPFVTATIGGRPAGILFAGAAPGYVTGVVQFNIQIPIGISGGALPIVVSINGVPSQTNATVAVQ